MGEGDAAPCCLLCQLINAAVPRTCFSPSLPMLHAGPCSPKCCGSHVGGLTSAAFPTIWSSEEEQSSIFHVSAILTCVLPGPYHNVYAAELSDRSASLLTQRCRSLIMLVWAQRDLSWQHLDTGIANVNVTPLQFVVIWCKSLLHVFKGCRLYNWKKELPGAIVFNGILMVQLYQNYSWCLVKNKNTPWH